MFGLKLLAICGAAVFTVKGIDNLFADAGGSTGKKEDAERTIEVCEITTTDIAAETQPEEKEEIQDTDVPGESQGMIGSMDWDSEDAYLLAKIAMAEAESEDVEGKALVIMVVLNRVWSGKFPDSIPEVIFQERQFSPVGNGRFDRVEPDRECYEALELIQLNQWDESQGALYFESEGKSNFSTETIIFIRTRSWQNEKRKEVYSKELAVDYSRSDSDRGIRQDGVCGERICCLRRRMADLTAGAYAGGGIKVRG